MQNKLLWAGVVLLFLSTSSCTELFDYLDNDPVPTRFTGPKVAVGI